MPETWPETGIVSPMRQFAQAIAVMASCLPTPGSAEGGRIVVELYTSQGCSSCPPADALMAKIARDPAILALSLHVDYWDYLGWKDEFADPAFTQRQKAYARAAGDRMIYTPQAVIGGRHREVGSDAAALMAAVMHEMHEPAQVALQVTREGAQAQVAAKALGSIAGPVEVLLIRYLPERSVLIEHGENAGATVTYVNIVTSWTVVGGWDPAAPLQMMVPLTGNDRAAILLQAVGMGAIVAAAEVP